MSYENSYSVSVIKIPTTTKNVNKCPICDAIYNDDIKFCGVDGEKLIQSTQEVSESNIIEEFKKFTTDGDLIKKTGECEMTGSGHEIESDLVIFSKKYPNGVFQIYGVPDSGFSAPDYKMYVENGKFYHENAKYVFEEYDKSKLK